MVKGITFLGSSVDDLRAFPEVARQRAGFQLYLVQSGKEPPDWKPMTTIGPRCREIRVRDASGAYRVFYVATLGDRFMSCTASRRRANGPPRKTSSWARSATSR